MLVTAESSSQTARDTEVSLSSEREAMRAELGEAMRESRQNLQEQLAQTTSAQEKRQLIRQWRADNQPLIDQKRVRREAESAGQRPATWRRSEIPADLPAEEREAMTLRYELREAQIALQGQLKERGSQDGRQAIADFRQQNASKMERLHELSASRRIASQSSALEPLPIPENLPAEEKARLEARNEQIAAVNELRDSLANAAPEERRAAIAVYRERTAAQRESATMPEPTAPATE